MLLVPWRMFLNRIAAARKRSGPCRQGGTPLGVNCPHGPRGVEPPSVGSSFRDRRRYSGRAAVPKANPFGGNVFAPPRPRAVSAEPYRVALPAWPRGSGGTTWDFHRSVSSAIVCRRSHQAPPRSRPRNRVSLPGKSVSGLPPLAGLGPSRRPNRDTSRTILTWPLHRRSLPSDPGCVPPPALKRNHAPPHCPWKGSSEDFRTGSDPPG